MGWSTSRSVRARRRLSLAVVVAIACWGAARAGAQEHAATVTPGLPLDAGRRATLDAGAQLVEAEAVAWSRWPRVTVVQFVDGSPEQVAAVFADFGRHAAFLPNVTRSIVAHLVDSATAEVDYTLRVPIVADESYTVRDHLERFALPSGERGYRVWWTLVRATSIKAADGEARFEPYRNERLGRDGTLVTYRNLVVPGSSLAGLAFVRARARHEVEETVRALGAQVEQERARDPALLERQLEALRRAVGSPP